MNAKAELINFLKNKATVKCVFITREEHYNEKHQRIILKENYSKLDYDFFLDKLDFNYNSGYGTQHIFGTIWLKDNTWISREEYDGSEWWNHNTMPLIPDECLG